MKAYGVRKGDNNCCIGHAKYGVKGLNAKGTRKSRLLNKSVDKSRKAKMRKFVEMP
jgi:hypothetical protein